MITYTEKGSGLHSAIQKAGHSLREENGLWVSSDDAAVQLLIDSYTLADAADYVGTLIDVHAKELRDKATKLYSPAEMASWSIKKAEADKIKKGGSSIDAPFLQLEAAKRGVTLQSIADRVTANADILGGLEAEIGGNAGLHKDAVKLLTTFAGISSYDWSAGWPVV